MRGDELEINSLSSPRFPGCVLIKQAQRKRRSRNRNVDVFDSSRVKKEAAFIAIGVCWKIGNNGAGGQNQLCPLLA